jgi:hypothetical protein
LLEILGARVGYGAHGGTLRWLPVGSGLWDALIFWRLGGEQKAGHARLSVTDEGHPFGVDGAVWVMPQNVNPFVELLNTASAAAVGIL